VRLGPISTSFTSLRYHAGTYPLFSKMMNGPKALFSISHVLAHIQSLVSISVRSSIAEHSMWSVALLTSLLTPPVPPLQC